MNKTLLIAPYKELLDLDLKNFKIDKEYALLNNVRDTALKHLNKGGEIVITRGGSADIIKDLDLIVIPIKITSSDILKAFERFKDSQEKIGVVGYYSIIEKAKWIANYLNIKFEFLELTHNLSEEDLLKKLKFFIKTEKITKFIGGTVLFNLLEKYNLPIEFELIKSNEEALLEAIKKSEEILKIKEIDKEKNKILRILLNNINIGMMYFDKNNNLKLENDSAKEIKVNLTDLEPFLQNKNPVINQVLKIGDKNILLNKTTIYIHLEYKGSLFSMRVEENIKNEEILIRKKLHKKGLVAKYTLDNFISKDPIINQIKEYSNSFAQTNGNILIIGESGTGKEILAQGIHSSGNRANGPFVAINCAAIPAQLLESELFGYEKGAFTGASMNGKAGVFELAHNGTIFLDEISELPLELQTKLLRVLQEGEVRRLGGDRVIASDFRVISACNVDLSKLVQEKKFRLDLYYRLNTLNIDIPPLRERVGDIELLINHFLEKFSKNTGKYVDELDLELLNLLKNYSWPGNVRELENIIHRIVLLTNENIAKYSFLKIFLKDLHLEFNTNGFENEILKGSMKNIKKTVIKKLLENKSKVEVAKQLEIDRGTLNRILNS